MKALILIVGVILLLIGGFFFALCLLLSGEKDNARTAATLKDFRHKKNVWIRPTLYLKPMRLGKDRIKDLTQARYTYTVGGKTYTLREDFVGTPRQTPRIVKVIYRRAFPRFACVDEIFACGALRYLVWALIPGIAGIWLMSIGICL